MVYSIKKIIFVEWPVTNNYYCIFKLISQNAWINFYSALGCYTRVKKLAPGLEQIQIKNCCQSRPLIAHQRESLVRTRRSDSVSIFVVWVYFVMPLHHPALLFMTAWERRLMALWHFALSTAAAEYHHGERSSSQRCARGRCALGSFSGRSSRSTTSLQAWRGKRSPASRRELTSLISFVYSTARRVHFAYNCSSLL